MAGPPRKRQRREEYREAQKALTGQNGDQVIDMPKKKFYRQRAHANPFSDHTIDYPNSPAEMDWSPYFPAYRTSGIENGSSESLTKTVEIADIGCGFGGLLLALSPLCPDSLIIGMELRTQVTDYVVNRVAALRSQNPLSRERNSEISPYHNISALRTNTMKFMPNYFRKSSLAAIFLCFPDPHFKARKHKARIVSAQLSAEYAYVVKPHGKIYTITDVEELHLWMVSHFVGEDAGDSSELWEQVANEENDADPMVNVMREETEEGKKVSRNGGKKYVAVFRRKHDPQWT